MAAQPLLLTHPSAADYYYAIYGCSRELALQQVLPTGTVVSTARRLHMSLVERARSDDSLVVIRVRCDCPRLRWADYTEGLRIVMYSRLVAGDIVDCYSLGQYRAAAQVAQLELA